MIPIDRPSGMPDRGGFRTEPDGGQPGSVEVHDGQANSASRIARVDLVALKFMCVDRKEPPDRLLRWEFHAIWVRYLLDGSFR